MLVESNYYAEYSTTTIDNSIINSCNFYSNAQSIENPCIIVQNSQINNSSFLASCSSCQTADLELFNSRCSECTFSAYYGELLINDSKIINSGFNNHNTDQQCIVSFDVRRSIIINTSIESQVTNLENEWSTAMKIDECIIKKDSTTIIGYLEGDMSNSIIIGTDNTTGIRILRSNFDNVTIVNNDIGIIREEDDLDFTVTNSNIFRNSTYNLQNNSFENISGLNNFWGATTILEIGELNYDYYDDINLGEVDITNYQSLPNTNCPITPPRFITFTEVSGNYELSWSANPEGDIAGYKLYYGLFDGFDFQYSIDIGNVTSFIIPDSVVTETMALTAYDTAIDNTDDMVDGNESWYSLITDSILNVITGCTDENACNYNPDAVANDGSCIIIGDACDDNDPNTIEDEITNDCTCEGSVIVYGCLNEEACNFNAAANVDDGSCLIIGESCDDNDSATLEDVVTDDCICAGILVGIKDISGNESDLVIYPNPVENELFLNFQLKESGQVSFEIYDILGIRVKSSIIALIGGEVTHSLNTKSLNAGIYILRISNGENTATQRFSIAR